jgi:DNA-binding NtrC family response regulator
VINLLCISSHASTDPETAWPGAFAGVSTEVVGPTEAIDRSKTSHADAVLVRLPCNDWTADEALEQIQRIDAAVPVILCDAEGTLEDAVRLTRLGAFHYMTVDDAEQLREVLERAAEHSGSRRLTWAAAAGANEPWRKFLVGESQPMQQLARVIRLVSPRRSTVLISGETGAGKEMVARAIHMAGDRAHIPLVAVNCTALPENLLEAELFGHVKGAFTGAIAHRIGRFEQAHRGTLFLDEVGDLPLDIQAKLLRVLQEREFQRIGSSETVKVDVRVIAASNIDLTRAVRQGKFREDLYYRLNVVPLHVPALRERPSDIPALVHHLIEKICLQEGLPPRRVTREALERLSFYSWPGNVRQLENATEMAIALSGDRETLYPADFALPAEPQLQNVAAIPLPTISLPDEGLDFEQHVANMERAILTQALRNTGGNKAQAAGMLRLKRTTLSAKLKSLARTA